MSSIIVCDHCGARFRGNENLYGRKVKCARCGQSFVAQAQDDDRVLDDKPPPVQTASPRQIPEPRSTPSESDTAGQAAQPQEGLRGIFNEIRALKINRRTIIALGLPLLVIAVVLGLLFGAGGSSSIDIRKVSANPAEYAGQVLRSPAIMEGDCAFRGIGSVGAAPLMLYVPAELEDKAFNVDTSVGRSDHVIVEYRIWTDKERNDIETWVLRENALEETLRSQLNERLADYSASKASRMTDSEIQEREHEAYLKAREWEDAKLYDLWASYKDRGWQAFQVDHSSVHYQTFASAFEDALYDLKYARDYDVEPNTPEYDQVVADITLCEQLRTQFEEEYQTIHQEMEERSKSFSREAVYAQYEQEDALAAQVTSEFQQEAQARRQQFVQEANAYFNKEYGHDYPGEGWDGILLNVKVP